jgi:hypothetical protein
LKEEFKGVSIMVGPIIIRDLLPEQLEHLWQNGKLAFVPRFSLEEDTLLMIWWEDKARWVYARVKSYITRPSYNVYEEHLAHSGFSNVEEWLSTEEKRLGGVLPIRLVLVEVESDQYGNKP